MSFLKILLLYICTMGTLKSFAQSTAEKGNWGFVVKGNANFFQTNEHLIAAKSDFGWGFGHFYSKNFNKLIGIDIETLFNFEMHTLTNKADNSSLKLQDLNIAVPLKLRLKLYKELTLLTGAEFLHVLSKQKEEFKLRENNYLALVGTSYALKFNDFTVTPEISYRLGINNSLEKSLLNDYDLKRSAVTFSVKIM